MAATGGYQLNITVIKARYLYRTETKANIYVELTLDKKCKRVSAITKDTDHPEFNEKIEFKFKESLETVLKKYLIISVYSSRHFGKKLVGMTTIELETVWCQPHHRFYHKWAVLNKSKDPFSDVRGYLKCDIYILGKGLQATIPIGDYGNDIEENLMTAPIGIGDKKKAFLHVNLYRADGIIRDKILFKNMYVKVTFGGVTHQTKVSKKNSEPIWNEAIIFSEPLPSLFQTITIEIWDRKFKYYVGGMSLSLNEISDEFRLGFLPSYGPCFAYLYREDISGKESAPYAARLLLSITTDVRDKFHLHKFKNKEKIPALDESIFPRNESFTLCFSLLQAVQFKRKLESAEFTVTLRHGGRFFNTNTKDNFINDSETHLNVDKNTLQFAGEKCATPKDLKVLQLHSYFPTLHEKEFNQNHLKHLFKQIQVMLEECEEIRKTGRLEEKSFSNLMATINNACKEIINIGPGKYQTSYDMLIRTSLHEELRKLKESVSLVKDNDIPLAEWLNYVKTHVAQSMEFTSDLNPTFPEIELSVLYLKHDKTYGKRLKPIEYIYSLKPYEKGTACGKVRTIFIKDSLEKEVCALDAFIWFGPTKQLQHCFNTLPLVDQIDNEYKTSIEIVSTESHVFELRVYIYQGRIREGTLLESTVSPFVRVSVLGVSQKTEVKKKIMDPIWDETLIFPEVIINANASFITEQSIGVIFDIVDYGSYDDNAGVIGRGVYRPIVNLKNHEFSRPRMRWMKAWNVSQVTAEVLMAMELIEISDPDMRIDHNPKTIYSIPDDIRPHYINNYLEVIFWGVREMKETHLSSCKSQLMAVVECNKVVISSNRVPFHSHANFDCEVHLAEILLPVEIEYMPPLVISIYQFGLRDKNECAGSCIISSIDMFSVKPARNSNKKPNISEYLKNLLGKESKLDADNEVADWWTKYYSSKQGSTGTRKIVMYTSELENQIEFDGFQDTLRQYPITLRKPSCALQNDPLTAILKGSIHIHSESDTQGCISSCLTPNQVQEFTVRIYIIAAHNLTPTDLNGRCDPYIKISLGKKIVDDRRSYVPNDVNPVFGKCYELKGKFPNDSRLKVTVKDYDACSINDTVGTTIIDIENRFYSSHHGTCGIADTYETEGYCQWRDVANPTEILSGLCSKLNLPPPEYSDQSIRMGQCSITRENATEEALALEVLKRFDSVTKTGFKIVPEHIEMRSLYHSRKPFIEQGKLEMWIDIFPSDMMLFPPVDITPRPPLRMELRVIVWQTVDVLLKDYNLLTGKKSSDIYIKGWLTDQNSLQVTDVHENSKTGEAKFNWRFVFPCNFSTMERKMIVRRHDKFSAHLWVEKLPCELEIQAWDKDVFSDDFIGSLTLNVDDMPEGKKYARQCTLKMMDITNDRQSLFKTKRMRGWWPLRTRRTHKSGEYSLAGKIELEIEVMSEDQARKMPVGMGREGPDSLPAPNRPRSTPLWKMNPLTFMSSFLFGRVGKKLLPLLLIGLLVLFVLIGFYSLPTVLLERFLGKN